MKFTSSQRALMEQLKKLVSVTEEKGIEQDYAYIGFDVDKTKGRLIGKDDQVILLLDIDVKSFKVENPGQIRIHADTFYNLLDKFDGNENLTIEADLQKLMIYIRSSNSESSFKGLKYEELPTLKMEPICKCLVPASLFRDSVWQVQFAASASVSGRTHIEGVELRYADKKLHFSATDEHQIAITTLPAEKVEGGNEASVVIPRGALQKLAKTLRDVEDDIAITFSETVIKVESKKEVFISKLLGTAYPVDLAKVLNAKWENHLILSTAEVKKSLDVVLQISEELKWVGLSYKKEGLEIHSGKRGFGQSRYDIKLEGPNPGNDFKFTCNGDYLARIIKHVSSDKLTISFDRELHKCFIQPEGNTETRYLLTALLRGEPIEDVGDNAKTEIITQ